MTETGKDLLLKKLAKDATPAMIVIRDGGAAPGVIFLTEFEDVYRVRSPVADRTGNPTGMTDVYFTADEVVMVSVPVEQVLETPQNLGKIIIPR